MRHAVHDAQAHIGESHAGDVLAQGHALAAVRIVLHGGAQAVADQLDGFQMEHIGNGAVALGDVALDGMGQGVHAGGGSEALGHPQVEGAWHRGLF